MENGMFPCLLEFLNHLEFQEESSKRIPIESGGRDTLRWSRSAHGDLSTSWAWELCRHRHPHTRVFNLIWGEATASCHQFPSLYGGCLPSNRIPVGAKLQWRKVSLESKCCCCRAPNVETREHLFLQGEVAVGVWRRVSVWFPKLPGWNERVIDLETRVRFWHRRLCRSDKLHASSVIPCLALWFIWSERNGHMIQSGKLRRKDWEGCDNLESLDTSVWIERPRKLIKMVKWTPPELDWIKLNIKVVWSRGWGSYS